MQKSVSFRSEYLHGPAAAMALLLGLGFAAPAGARGLVADDQVPPNITACSLGATACRLTDLDTSSGAPTAADLGDLDNIFIYSDGVAAFFNALPGGAALGDLSTLGPNFVAPGFADYSGLNGKVSYRFHPLSDELLIYWTFTFTSGGNPADAIFGLDITSLGSGTYDVSANYGIVEDGVTWYSGLPAHPYCDALCDSQALTPTSDSNADIEDAFNNQNGHSGDGIAGVFVPAAALIGSSYAGGPVGGTGFKYGDYFFTVSEQSTVGVPEPATWPVMAFGLCAMGALLRRRPRTVSAR